MSGNPLLASSFNELPNFSLIKPEHVEEAIDFTLAQNRAQLSHLLETNTEYTWDNLIWPLEIMEGELNDRFALVTHLEEVANTPALHAAYQAALAKLSLYHTELMQNEKLYRAVLSLSKSSEYEKFDIAQNKIIENIIRDFKLSGIELPTAEKEQFKKISIELSELESQFGQNVLEATAEWSLHISDIEELKGVSEHALASAAEAAKNKGKTGWLLTLDYPCYHAVITYAENKKIREILYTAYVTRAATDKYDNSAIMVKIMQLRQKLARLLGYKNYAEYALVTRMLKTPEKVTGFLSDLLHRARKSAEKEIEELKNFVQAEYGITALEPWDIAYFSEKILQKNHSFSEEMLRPYFSEKKVLTGLFEITNKLYDLEIKEVYQFDRWHADVRLFEVYDSAHILKGKFYLDLYTRQEKQGGAWVANAKLRMRRPDGQLQIPVIYLTTNFSKTVNSTSNLLTHDEVLTLFHEFGHCLHHILTKVDFPAISTGNGIMWDAIELPSQLMENWCWEKEALDLLAQHVNTNANIPEALFLKLKATKNFQAGLKLIRQLEFALFDFELHEKFSEEETVSIQKIMDEVRQKTAIIPVPIFNRFQNSFTHIFSGSYAAGYYSYLWSEVLSADAYEHFRKNNKVFDKLIAKQFLMAILEPGGIKDFMELFIDFRGRPPKVDALLRDYQLI